MPNCWNLAVRAFCRWHASCTIWSVAAVGFGPVLRAVDAVGVDVVAVVAVWAHADRPAMAKAATTSELKTISFKGGSIGFIASSELGGLQPSIPSLCGLGYSWVALGQDLRRGEGHAILRRVGGIRDHGLRRVGVRAGDPRHQELDAHQQGEVLVHGVVAVIDVGAAILAELDLELHLAAGTQAPDVLAYELFRCRDGGAPPVHGDAFLEVQVDRVIPATAAIDIGPMLDIARLGDHQRDEVGVHRVRLLTIDSNRRRTVDYTHSTCGCVL